MEKYGNVTLLPSFRRGIKMRVEKLSTSPRTITPEQTEELWIFLSQYNAIQQYHEISYLRDILALRNVLDAENPSDCSIRKDIEFLLDNLGSSIGSIRRARDQFYKINKQEYAWLDRPPQKKLTVRDTLNTFKEAAKVAHAVGSQLY